METYFLPMQSRAPWEKGLSMPFSSPAKRSSPSQRSGANVSGSCQWRGDWAEAQMEMDTDVWFSHRYCQQVVTITYELGYV